MRVVAHPNREAPLAIINKAMTMQLVFDQSKLHQDAGMTYRLMPIGSCGRAEANFADIPVEIADDDVFGDVASDSREVASAPEPLPPVVFADTRSGSISQ